MEIKKVLFSPIYSVSPHYETDCELIKEELSKGSIVYYLYCNKSKKYCENRSLTSCKHCINTQKRALKILKSKNLKVLHLTSLLRKIKKSVSNPSFQSVEDLKKINYLNYPIGYGICSSLADQIDSIGINANKKYINIFFEYGVKYYNVIIFLLKKLDIDYGYIFNGRFCYSRAFIAAFESLNKDFYTHERGSSLKKYVTYKNTLPHDINDYANRINDFWTNSSLSKKEKQTIATKWFNDKRNGKETDFISFTKKQKKNSLPQIVNQYKKIVTIFNSSTFEYDFVSDDYTYKMYNSQSDGIFKILQALSNYPDVLVIVREHPNLANRNNQQKKDLRIIHFPNYYLITGDQQVSSYELLDRSDVIVTFNSTMGIEATFWGKPSILCSNSIYQNLDIAYQPDTHEEVVDLLLKKDLKPKDKKDCIKLGYYSSEFGTCFKYYNPETLFSGKFQSVNLQKHLEIIQSPLKYIDLLKPLLKRVKPIYKIYQMIKTKHK